MSNPPPIPSPGFEEEGSLYEIFSGVQGEGLLVGERQIFIRLGGCNLSCSYCDSADARVSSDRCRIEHTPGLRDFSLAHNPFPVSEVSDAVERLDVGTIHHSIAITGGEPLVQAGFVRSMAAGFHSAGLRVMLETNGTLPERLSSVLPFIDVVSMDFKLPSSLDGRELWAIHQEFLQISTAADVYVKIVVTDGTSESELLLAAEIIRSVDRSIPLILQPVTPQSGVLSPSPSQVLQWQAKCSLRLRSVRVIPQCHKIMNQM